MRPQRDSAQFGCGSAALRRFQRCNAVPLLLVFCIVCPWVCAAEPGKSPALAHEAYVWQRDWNVQVRETVSQLAPRFSRMVVLGAEVGWVQKKPRVVRIPLDYAVLRNAGCSVGLALRIGPFAGPFGGQGEPISVLSALATSMIEESRANGLPVSELQIDFDCAASKLKGYRTWLEAIRKSVEPVPVGITALPSWLREPGFKELVSAASSYVLQVHSLERPKDIHSTFALCDPAAARRAVDLAGTAGVPFTVALPTYGYVIAFHPDGEFLGLAAEGPSPNWPAGVQTREIRAVPADMAGLVQGWSRSRLELLKGVIWYRLPVPGDRLNWPWPTLAAVMNGRTPIHRLRAEASRPEPGLVQITLINEGEADCPAVPAVRVRWRSGRLIAADALQGFRLASQDSRSICFEAESGAGRQLRISPGGKRGLGWLRLSSGVEGEVDVELAGSLD